MDFMQEIEKKRLCVFSFYDEKGCVDDYVFFLLQEIKPFLKKIIIVINGEINECARKTFSLFTDGIYIRENKGFDAGAYRHILLHCVTEEELKSYDEIIFCNNTFFGPLYPFAEIFMKANRMNRDFWGLTGYADVVFSHIQSFFLVFGKKIIDRGFLTEYFRYYIDENTDDISIVYCQFETGLFDYLTRKCQMTYGIIAELYDLDMYLDSYRCLTQDKVPVIKKKVFNNMVDCPENVWRTISYIKYYTSYDVRLILDYLSRVYSYNINFSEILPPETYPFPPKMGMPVPCCSDVDIENFLQGGTYYIYGAGIYAYKAYWRYAREIDGLKGFVVSDYVTDKPDTLFGYPVRFFHEVRNEQNIRILLGVKTAYADEIEQELRSEATYDILRIF